VKSNLIAIIIAIFALLLAGGSFLLNTGSVVMAKPAQYWPGDTKPLNFLHADGSEASTTSYSPVLLKSYTVPAWAFRKHILVMFDFGFRFRAAQGYGWGEGKISLKIDGIAVKSLDGYAWKMSSPNYNAMQEYRSDSCTVYVFDGDMAVDHTIELWGDTLAHEVYNNMFMIMGT